MNPSLRPVSQLNFPADQPVCLAPQNLSLYMHHTWHDADAAGAAGSDGAIGATGEWCAPGVTLPHILTHHA